MTPHESKAEAIAGVEREEWGHIAMDNSNQTAAEQVMSEDEILKAADHIRKRRFDEENERETIAVLRRQNAAMRRYLTEMALSGKIPGCWDSAWGRLPDILNNSLTDALS